MEGAKRILIFSMAGGTGRSYHADLACNNRQRRVHYLLEPGWRADQAIQGLGRSNRTNQAWPPLFRPVTTDVKGERRFIATIARRLDSLGAITRGQRDSQTAMGGDDTALFRESDNLESPYAKAALLQFYRSLHRGSIDDWSTKRFEDATGLKLTWEGTAGAAAAVLRTTPCSIRCTFRRSIAAAAPTGALAVDDSPMKIAARFGAFHARRALSRHTPRIVDALSETSLARCNGRFPQS